MTIDLNARGFAIVRPQEPDDRGERESVAWFPLESEAEAREFAEEGGFDIIEDAPHPLSGQSW
ncbi:hypothetical protein QDA11_gp75 [Microbacterium phage Jayden]|uniref:Uncharacterized protein n=1 Tax=Microbacterium phage Jayden TaxID=2656550 RepID=A0A649VSV6_9CAUD|nr:hypothetical protein QDA11_gp75 [Microbacterium phage Jayden]QGJ95294.1 hypothetical protein PBI_JAYDEN_75 [Microbacterium phage Jayden]